MSRFALPVVSVCLFLLWSASLAGSDSDAIVQKAKAIHKEAAALAEKGDKEAAEKLEAKARELLELAERLQEREPDRTTARLEMLEAHLKELLVKQQQAREAKASEGDLSDLRQQIAATKAVLDKLRSEQKHRPDAPGPDGEKLAIAVQRIQHLRAAAEHLRAAGADELSRHVAEQAEQMEREVRKAKERLAKESGDQGNLPGQIEEMRKEMQRMRAELEELRRQVKEK